MNTSNLTWTQAALRVLEEAGESLHYTEVGDRIAQQALTKGFGATPANQANSALQQLVKEGKVERVAKGIFAVPEIAHGVVAVEEEQEAGSANGPGRLSIGAYGLYWSRGQVDWEPTNGKLLGRAGGTAVDFGSQEGIYLLHSGNEVVYVGQSRAQAGHTGLYIRLRTHNFDYRKTDRWDTFSWFGFLPVNPESGELLPVPDNASTEDVINIIEAILIEGLMPRLNMRRGDGTADWLEANQYFQVPDPSVFVRRLTALTQVSQALD
jgi:hypothetical protein